MPSYPCKHPTCTAYVPGRPGYCPEHQEQGQKVKAERHRFYDQHQRDQSAKSFYNSAAWQRSRATKLAANPVCEKCLLVFADTVHHIIPLERCTPEQRTAQGNLKSLCHECHSSLHAAAGCSNL